MKKNYKLFLSIIFLGSFFNVNAQIIPCNLTGGSVYLDYAVSPAMMNATVNGMSMYDYVWNNGITGANQTQIYSGWCVTITDLVSGCDTTICENCIPDTTTICPCPMIYMPVCGCDGVMYPNSCIAICAGVGWTPAVSNGMPGGWMPCTTASTTCFVELITSGSTTFCEGDSVQLQPSVYDINGSYLWNTGSTNHEIWVSLTGDYVLSYTNDTGCVATDTMHVEVIPEPILISYTAPNPAIICLGDTLVIELTPGLSNYYWNTGNPLHQDQDRIEITPTQDFIYVCEALDSNGCESRVEIEVFVDSCANGVYSEVFSKIEIYPNPTRGGMRIDFPENDMFNISLYSVEGKLVIERGGLYNSTYINSEDIGKGSYILKIENSKGSVNRKVIFD